MLVLDPAADSLLDEQVANLDQFLTARDCLIFNDTRVIPARLFGHKETGGKVEVLVERVVYSFEYGAVWIVYLLGTDVSGLEPLVAADEHLLMSPVDGLDVPLMISAWGAQVAVDGPDDPRIAAFIDTYIRNGPEAAPCVGGGVGEPPTDIGPGLDA